MYKLMTFAACIAVLCLQFDLVTSANAHHTHRKFKSGEGIKLISAGLGQQTLKRSQAACNYLRTRHGMSELNAAAVVGHLIQESRLIAHGYEGDRGSSFGVAQWRGIRFKALKRFAKNRGHDWRNLYTQLDFIAHELATTERKSGRAYKRS